ncbi:MAG: hypothetical protein ABFD91_12545 [Anaerohalosphaeraceae bacterium]
MADKTPKMAVRWRVFRGRRVSCGPSFCRQVEIASLAGGAGHFISKT